MKIDFYYWNYMCPLNYEMIELLKKYQTQLEIHFHDITNNKQLAKQLRIFYPTLAIINDTYRHYSPITPQFLDSLCAGVIPEDIPYKPNLGEKEFIGKIIPITRKNYSIAGCCTGKNCLENCIRKMSSPLYDQLPILGFMNIDSDILLGGVEYIPSIYVPYDIPGEKTTAFITCVYLSDTQYDYKSPCLRALEEYLSGDYKKILVISDETGIFPNGNLNFFKKNGYDDLGILTCEKNYCTLHLMSKKIS
ncbi:MAG: hypothetical protein NC434_15540 [Ruminococcus sp.]|nr:hypothetical protein [Ruminococcus sp.]